MSSLGGSCRCGNRARSRRTVSIVSSTDSVVWDSQTTRSGSRTTTSSTSSGPSTSWMWRGRLPRRAVDLLVTGVADEQDVVVVGGEPDRLLVHLRHERAGRVDRPQRRRCAACSWTAGATPCAEKMTSAALGHLVGLVDEDRAATFEGLDDVLVVDDLLADVHRRAVVLEGLLDGDDGPVDPGAVAPRRGEQHPPSGRPQRLTVRRGPRGGGGCGHGGRRVGSLGHPSIVGGRPRTYLPWPGYHPPNGRPQVRRTLRRRPAPR